MDFDGFRGWSQAQLIEPAAREVGSGLGKLVVLAAAITPATCWGIERPGASPCDVRVSFFRFPKSGGFRFSYWFPFKNQPEKGYAKSGVRLFRGWPQKRWFWDGHLVFPVARAFLGWTPQKWLRLSSKALACYRASN